MSWEAMTFTEARVDLEPIADTAWTSSRSLRAWWHYGSGTVCDKARSQNDPGWISECDPSEPEFRHPQMEGDTHGRWPSGGSCDDLLYCKCVRGPVSDLKATVGHILKGHREMLIRDRHCQTLAGHAGPFMVSNFLSG